MTGKSNIYLSRGIDYSGEIGAKLRDLQGYGTLAHELIQNADDAPNVTAMSFDVRDEALIVDNNGVFSACKQINSSDCLWKEDGIHNKLCDFHRFRRVSSGDKRGETGTTGAFGFGFISVYQITDHPELISTGQHWILHDESPEEGKRIEVCKRCRRCNQRDLPGTRFILTWAFDSSSILRQILNTEPVPPDGPTRMIKELERTIPVAMVFLRRIRTIEVKRNGNLQRTFQKEEDGETLILTDGKSKNDRIWHIIHGEFDEAAEKLRTKHPRNIEGKRLSKVSLAIPESPQNHGLLFACLPTEHNVGLPFHINADFFPTNDRKRVILADDYQSEWNRAALKAAADAMVLAIEHIRDLLGPRRFWDFLSTIKSVAADAKNGQRESELKMFWELVATQLKIKPVIYTTKGCWKIYEEASLLRDKDEASAIPILEILGIDVVDENLRPYQSLLLSDSVGVPLLNIRKIYDSLVSNGFNRRVELNKLPKEFKSESNRKVLYDEIALLLDKQKQNPKEHENDISLLKDIAIAPGRDGALWPCGEIFFTDEKTVTLFEMLGTEVPFASNERAFKPLLNILCKQFDVNIAIDYLNKIDDAVLKNTLNTNRLLLEQLFEWFDNQREQILNDEELKNNLRTLPIFPSSKNLHKLDELYLPGDFNDPLGLSELIDLTLLGKRDRFFIDLGMKTLGFLTYVKDRLPVALDDPNISDEKRWKTILFLAEHLEIIRNNSDVRQNLSQVHLIQCSDSQFRSAFKCYFNSDLVRDCLGESAYYVDIPKDKERTIHEVYEWLGVTDKPRFVDIVSIIQRLSGQSYSTTSKTQIQKIVSYLNLNFEDDVNTSELEQLKNMRWLPAHDRIDRWYAPNELYTTDLVYLFKTQAPFLDFTNLNRELRDFLCIRRVPDINLVIKHLIECSMRQISMDYRLYEFLNTNLKSDDPNFDKLRDMKCLYINDEYYRPNEVFWSEHPFGRYRWRLVKELHHYNNLLSGLDVKDNPDYLDALLVLKEISLEFGSENKPLDNDAENVLKRCWEMLGKALKDDSLNAEDLKELQSVKCVLNKGLILNKPEWMFFENRAGLAEKFDGFLDNNVIPRPLDAGNALSAAGVRPLRSSVKVSIEQCKDATEDKELAERIRDRWIEIGRVLESQDIEQTTSVLERLQDVRCKSVSSLIIRYSLHFFNTERESKSEQVDALYQVEDKVLFFKRRDNNPPWAAIARELAVSMFPDEDPGRFAAGLKEVLQAETRESAESTLDELGYARVDISKTISSESPIVRMLGEHEKNSSEDVEKFSDENDSNFTHQRGKKEVNSLSAHRYEHDSKLKHTGNVTVDNRNHKQGSQQSQTRGKVIHCNGLDYITSLQEAFNRPGKVNRNERLEPFDSTIPDIERRRKKEAEAHQERVANEPDPGDRRRTTEGTILEGPDEQVRKTLEEWYGGKCQICGDTFPERDGRSFFIAKYIVERKSARQVDASGNALCLCADHFARWQHGAIEADDIKFQIDSLNPSSEDGSKNLEIRVILCGEECIIKFDARHTIALQSLIKATSNEDLENLKVGD